MSRLTRRPVGEHCSRPFNPSPQDRKSTRLNSSHLVISYAVFRLKKEHLDAVQGRLAGGCYFSGCQRTGKHQTVVLQSKIFIFNIQPTTGPKPPPRPPAAPCGA